MSKFQTNVVAVVPAYNSTDLVIKRVKQLQQYGFTKIIICDDASSDNTIENINTEFGTDVLAIHGEKNLGPGGNRNRCLNALGSKDEIVLFVDADCELIYEGNLPDLITNNFSSNKIGVIGFGILDNKQPMHWNYGNLMHPVHEAGDQKALEMFEANEITQEQFVQAAPALAASLRMAPETVKQVGWVAEGCFAIRADLFKELHGFDTNMRYHETHDLNARVQQLGYKTLFDPTPVVEHLKFDSRFHRRSTDERDGRNYYYKKHWNMSEETFKHLVDE